MVDSSLPATSESSSATSSSSSAGTNTQAAAASGASSSLAGTGTAAASTTSSSNSSPIHQKPTEAIIGGVIGGLVLVSLLLTLFYFNCRRNNQRSQALSDTASVPSPDVVNPFTVPPLNPTTTTSILSQKYTSNGQSLPSHSTSSKFIQRGQPSNLASTSSSGGSPSQALTPPLTQFSSPAFISPSSSLLPLTGSQTNFDGTKTIVPQAATEPSRQRSPSPRSANARYLRHEDSGVRIPPAEDDLIELPPLYTPG